LNNLLQVITESSQFLQRFTGGNPEASRYYDMMRSALDRAAQLSRGMLERSAQPSIDRQQPKTHPFPGPGSFGSAPAPDQGRQSGLGSTRPVEVRIANPDGARELIMIVDDEDFVTLLAQRVLTDEGYRVVTARDGFQALDIYKKIQSQIGLVILDFTMPIMDGSEVFNELRMINPQVPVVLSSGFTEQDKLKWMLAKGLRGFIPKPYTQQKLLLQVRSTLDAMKGERRD
jgi:CheY-like chemotaxis protein